jgi:hypothetical protein
MPAAPWSPTGMSRGEFWAFAGVGLALIVIVALLLASCQMPLR